MNKSDLKYKLRKNLKTDGVIKISDVNSIVDEVFNIIMESLEEGEDVTISGFGRFSTSTIKGHYGRHPKNNFECIKIPESTRVNFKAGREMKRRVNGDDK